METFSLLKLHGSINWFYSGTADSVGETIYYTNIRKWGNHGSVKLSSKKAVDDKVPLIVPPTTEKNKFFHHESIRYIWHRAERPLKEAEELYSIGYSLPPSDLAIRLFLLEGSNKQKKKLFIVNPDVCVVERYSKLLGHGYEIRDDYVGTNALQRFLQRLVKDADCA